MRTSVVRVARTSVVAGFSRSLRRWSARLAAASVVVSVAHAVAPSGGTISLPLTTDVAGKVSLGSFSGGTIVQFTVTGSGDLVDSRYQTRPDGALAAAATGAYSFANAGATNGTPAGGDGINHFSGGGATYDFSSSGFGFAGKQTTDTTDVAAIRFGAVVGTFAASPARADWFLIGNGGAFTVPVGGATLYVAVNDSASADNHGSYSLTYAVVTPSDSFAGASAFTGAGLSLTGSSAGASKESGEPNHAGNIGGASVWWAWTAPKTGVAEVSTIGSDFNTLLAVYTGTSVSALNSVASNIGGGGNGASKLTFNAAAGTTYRIAVDGVNSGTAATGNIVLNVDYAYYFGTLAGSYGSQGGANGTGSAARFSNPRSVVVDGAGNVYAADQDNNAIRKITPAGVVTTLAGGNGIGATDGAGNVAQFHFPTSVALDGAGNVYVTDNNNHTIRKVTPAGMVSTLAGQPGVTGSADGTGSGAQFSFPDGIGIDSAGNVFVVDSHNNTIRKVTPTGVVSTFAGQAGSSGSLDATGNAARFNAPQGLAVDASGNVYVSDRGNQTIRKISAAGVVTTLAGSVGLVGSVDGVGAAARFNGVYNLAVDGAGNVFLGDVNNATLRRITPAGLVTTIGGSVGNLSGTDGVGSAARFSAPDHVAVDASGNLYVADAPYTIRIGSLAIAPQIQAQPVGIATTAGNNATFSVATLVSAAATSYQWTLNGAVISGATNSTYSVTNAQFANVGAYRVIVSNSFGSTTSNAAVLSATNAAPTINTQPTDQSVAVNQSASFSVSASGAGTLSYQWRRNGVPVSGAVNSTFTIGVTSQNDADYYDVIVIDGLASTVSNTVRLGVAPAAYPTNIEIDPAFNLPAENSAGGTPTVVAQHNNGSNTGTLVAGGDLIRVISGANNVSVRRIARFNADGSLDTTFCANAAITGFTVNALVEQPADHKILVGGQFNVVNGASHFNLARLNANGTVDSSFNPSVSGIEVLAIALQSDGKILVGGSITNVNGAARTGLARLNSDGTLDTGFNPSIVGDVRAIAVQPSDSAIVIGGNFTSVGGSARGGIARLSSSGALDTGFAAGAGFNTQVNALGLDSTGRIFAGGNFTNYNGTSANANRLVRLAASDGGLDGTFGGGSLNFNGNVNTLVVQPDDRVVCGGGFSFNAAPPETTSIPVSFVMRVNTDGSVDNAGFPHSANGGVNSLCRQSSDGAIVLTGLFNTVGATSVSRLARVSSAGTVDTSLSATFRGAGSVNRIIPLPSGQWLAVGSFTHLGNTAVGNLARFTYSAGALTLDTTFNTGGTGANGMIFAAVPLAGGKIAIGGSFSLYGDHNNTYAASPNVARLNADGTFDTTFNTSGSGPNGTVYLLAAAPGGGLYVGGGFNGYMGENVVAASGLIRANADGSLDKSFAAGTSSAMFSSSTAIAVQRDGKVLLGGNFVTTIGSTPVTRLLRLNTDGSVDTGFATNLGSSADGTVNGIAVQPDGAVVVAGNFTHLNGAAVNRVARLAANGTPDGTYNTNLGTGAASQVFSVLRQEDGKVLLYGFVNNLNSLPRTNGLARVGANGTPDSAFGVYGNFNISSGSYLALAELDDGTVLVGNNTTAISGVERIGLAHFRALTAPTIAANPANQTATLGGNTVFSVTANGSAFNTYQWLHNGAAIPGATNSSLALNNLSLADAGNYAVTVTNPLGSVISSPATLTGPNPAPFIGTQPQSTVVTSGQAASLSVSATGTGTLAYQWRRNGFPIASATTATLAFASAAQSDADVYDVVVADGLSITVSNPARLGVAPVAYPQGLRIDPNFALNAENDNGGQIAVLAAYGGSGQFLAGGDFVRLNGTSVRRLVRFNSNGSVDGTFTASFDSTVSALLVQPDGNIVVGGQFAFANGTNRSRIVRLTPTGAFDSTFSTASNNPNSNVVALGRQTVGANAGKLIIGGSFNFVGSNSRNLLARLNADGSFDSTFNANLSSNSGSVNAIAIDANDNIYIGGSFTSVGVVTVNNLARLSANGALDTGFSSSSGGSGVNGTVNTLLLDQAATPRLLVGGAFTSFTSAAGTTTTVNRLARISAAGVLDTAFNSGSSNGPSSTVNALALDNNSPARVLVGGGFTSYSGTTGINRFVRLGDDGTRDATLSVSPDNNVNALLYDSTTDTVVLGGSFLNLGASTAKSLVRVFSSGASIGTRDTNLAITTRAAGVVNVIRPLPGNKWLVGGAFTVLGSTAVNNLARLDSALAVDPSFASGTGPNGSVLAAAVQGDGKIVLGGNFTTFNGATANRVARLNADGSLDSGFSVGSGPSGSVNAIALLPGGALYVGGSFGNFNNLAINQASLVRLTSTGALDPGFNAGSSSFGVSALVVEPTDGKVIVGGNFTLTLGGQTRTNLARFNLDGSLDSTFNPSPAAGPGSQVRSIAVVPADLSNPTRLVIGGDFTTYNGTSLSRLARINLDGSLDNTFSLGGAAQNSVHGITRQEDGRLLLNGNFGNLGGLPNTAVIGRLNADGTPDPSLSTFAITSTFIGIPYPLQTLDDGSVLLGLNTAIGDVIGNSYQERFGLVRLIPAPAPAVASLSSNSVRPGQTITLTGSGFINVTAVRLGGAGGLLLPSTGYVVNSATQITLTVPLGAVSGPVFVQTLYGTVNSAPVAIAPDWALQNPQRTAASFQAIAYANGIYVAVGFPGDIVISTDLVTWTPRYNSGGLFANLRSVVYANGLFVAVGANGTILTSSDGQAWTPRVSGTLSNFSGVTFGNGKFVAVTGTSTVATSTDGLSWSATSSGTNLTSLNAVAFGNNAYVGVGNGGAIFKSADGASWTAQTSPTGNSLNAIIYTGSLFVAVGSNATLLTSTDGATWTQQSAPGGFGGTNLTGVTFGADKYVAVGGTTVLTSTNATTWSGTGVFDIGNSQGPLNANAILFDGSQFVTAGFPGSIHTSFDLTTWTLHNAFTRETLNDVAFGNGRFVAVGVFGAFVTVGPGNTPPVVGQVTPGSSATLNDVAYGNGLFAAVGTGALFISTDGTTWTDRTPGGVNPPTLNGVAYGGGNWSAVGQGGVAYRSTDGVNWVAANTGTFTTLNAVAYGGSAFVAVGNGGAILTSPDGGTWTTQTSGTTDSLNGVTYTGAQFVAVGNNSRVLTSPTGVTWTPQTLGTSNISLTDVAAGDGAIVATNFSNVSAVFVSVDGGVTWALSNLTSHLLNSNTSTGIGFGNGRFVIAGLSGEIVRSNPASDTLSITTQPVGVTDTSATLTVAATGAGLSYQWYQGNSGDTTTAVAGANSATLNTGTLSASARYWVRVTSGSTSVDSAAADVLGAPAIVAPPQSITVKDLTAVTFTVSAIGAGPLGYQWRFNGLAINGATSASYTIPMVTAASAGAYSVVVSGLGSPATSAAATLTVTPTAPSFAQQPLTVFGSVAVQSHTSGAVNVFVSGTPPLTYQWQKNGVNLPGGSGTVNVMSAGLFPGLGTAEIDYQINNWQSSDAGVYSITLTNAQGSLGSMSVPLYVSGEAAWDSHGARPTTDILTSVNLVNGQFVITGTRGTRFGTTDGTSFTSLPSLSTNNSFAYAFGNGLHLLSGTLGFYSTSNDGNSWTSRHYGFGNETAVNVVFGAGKFAAALSPGHLITSPDGVTWTQSLFDADGFSQLAYGNGVFALLSNGGKLYTSTDAVTWTSQFTAVSRAPRVDLLAHWNFDETSGATAHDSAAGFHGTLGGTAAFVPGGISGNALSLDGSAGSLVNMGTGFPGLTSGNFTLSAWIKTTTTTATAAVAKHESGTFNGYFLAINSSSGYGQLNKAYFYDSTAPAQIPVSAITVNDGQWHHLAGVYTAGGNTALYVDGVFQGTGPAASIGANGAPLLFGGVNVGGVATGGYSGLIDDVQVYTGALTADEVAGLYSNPGRVLTQSFGGDDDNDHGLKFINGQFLIGTGSGNFYTSPTAALGSWTSHSLPASGSVSDIAFGAGLYVVITDSGTIYTSPDLSLWTPRNSGTQQTLNRIAFGNGVFMAVGGSNSVPVVLTSSDGINWTNRASILTNNTLNAVAANAASSLVAVGNNGQILRSVDATTWTSPVSNTGSALLDIAYSSSTYVAVGNGGTIRRSTDNGVTWTNVSSATTNNLRFVDSLNGQFVTTGDAGTILKSTDAGATWSAVTGQPTTTNYLGGAFGASTHVFVGSNGTIVTTPDLSAWTTRTSGTSNSLNEVAFGAGLFVAVGNNGTILTSPDGATWTSRSLAIPESFNWVGYSATAGGFAATGTNGCIFVSTDGISWTARYTGIAGGVSRLNEAVTFNGRLFGVGPSGTIVSGGLAPVIGQQPFGQTVLAGTTARFRVIARGSAVPIAYQWLKNGAPISGNTSATTAELVIPNAQVANVDLYSVTLTIGGTTATSAAAPLNIVTALPAANLTVPFGGAITLASSVTSPGSVNYSWVRSGSPVSTSSSIAIGAAGVADGGVYQLNISSSPADVFRSGPITLVVITSDLRALSSRAFVPAGGSIGSSFTIEGTQAKTILLRGAGPILTSFGVTGALVDPRLALFDNTGAQVAANDDWGLAANAAAITSATAQVGAIPFSSGSKDAAILATLNPGTYHVVLDGVGGTGGVALLEAYDADTDGRPRIVLLTTRANVGSGSNLLIAGFTVAGSSAKTFLIRALGESLGNSNGVLTDPVLSLYNGPTLVDSNDDWSSSESTSVAAINAASATVGAQPLATGTLDSALLVTLAPGSYTAQVAGFGGATGTALLEVYQVDAQRPATLPPVITYLSAPQLALAGDMVTFGVNVVAKPGATYQWRKAGVALADGANVFGSTSSVLMLHNVQSSDAANYDVVITSGTNTFTSGPRALTVLPDFHSADTNQDGRISLVELTRVIQLYNFTVSGSRTGQYHTQALTEDGFAPGPGTITSFHSADIDHDGKISLTELMRVVLLFNYVNGSGARTGEYHAALPGLGTEDGFAPGPKPFVGGL